MDKINIVMFNKGEIIKSEDIGKDYYIGESKFDVNTEIDILYLTSFLVMNI